jgi:hypothetical protein
MKQQFNNINDEENTCGNQEELGENTRLKIVMR